MSTTGADPTGDQGAYIRGGSAQPTPDARRLVRVVAAGVIAALVAVAVVLAFSASRDNSERSQLRGGGIPVAAHVTGCIAVSSGIAQAVTFYTCRASFTLDGREHTAALRGTGTLHPVGQQLAAVTVRGNPSLLYTAAAAADEHPTWTAYAGSVAAGSVAAVSLLAVLLWSRLRLRRG